MSQDKTCVFGLHSVQSLLEKKSDRVIRLLVLQDRKDRRLEALIRLAKEAGIEIDRVTQHELDRVTDFANHQAVVALCRKEAVLSEHQLSELLQSIASPPLLLVLDGVQDPHNLGACFRSADAAGVHAIIAPKDKSVGLTPTVSKVASGAAENVPFVQVTNLVRTLEELKEVGIWIYGAAEEATQTLYEANLSGAVAIVLGAEGKGLRRLTKEHCDVLLRIPMHGSVSSLNVSVATGIFLFEAVRQRVSVHDPN